MKKLIGFLSIACMLLSAPKAALCDSYRPQGEVFDDGLRLLVDASNSNDAAIRIIVFGGAVHEARNQRGLANITAQVLVNPVTSATTSKSIHTLNSRLDRIGAKLKVNVGLDFTVFSLDAPKQSIIEGLDLLLSNLSSPSISIDRIKSEALLRSRTVFGSSGDDLASNLSANLYTFEGENLLDPTRTSSQGIDQKAVLNFFRTYYRPDRLFVLATGGVSASNVRGALKSRMLLPMPDNETVFVTNTSTSILAQPQLPIRKVGLASPRQVIYGFEGCNVLAEDTASCIVLGEVLRRKAEASLQTQLKTNISVDGGYVMLPRDGFFALRVQSGKWKGVPKQLTEIALSLSRNLKSQDLEEAKKGLSTRLTWQRAHPSLLADHYVNLALTGRRDPVDYESLENDVRSVDVAGIKATAKKYLREDKAFLLKLTPVMK